jgi:hypothetical protein
MVDSKRYEAFKKYRSYWHQKLNRMLYSIQAQNEQIMSKLKDIEDLLFKEFADRVARRASSEDKSE